VPFTLREVRTAFGIQPKYPSAAVAWKHAIGKHPGDRTPPYGAPLFWAGGRKGFGHIAIMTSNGLVRSSDAGGRGLMGTKRLSWFERHWGQRYLGWAEGFNGMRIPGLGTPAAPDRTQPAKVVKPSKPAKPPASTVSLSNLRWGIRHQDVTVYQNALRAKGYAKYNPSGATGYYGAETKAMTAAFQQAQGWRGKDADGFPGTQTLHLLGLKAR
jgi:hypothetical protein